MKYVVFAAIGIATGFLGAQFYEVTKTKKGFKQVYDFSYNVMEKVFSILPDSVE